MRRLFAILAIALVPASVAIATEPSSGEVSTGSPKFAWTGSTTNSYPNYVAMNNNPEDVPCQSPTCDTFTLTVVGGGVDLIVRANMDKDGSTGPANTGVRITKPDGTKVWTTGPSGATQQLKITVKKAPAGEYVIDLTNNFVGQPQTFSASAELVVPPPAATPAPAPAAAPPAEPAPAQQPPAPAPDTKLTVKPIKAKSARSKKLSAAVSTSAPVTGVTATLARGGKKIAVARTARINSRARMAIKSKKALKPGKYLLTVTGTDGQGRTVTGQAPVTVRR